MNRRTNTLDFLLLLGLTLLALGLRLWRLDSVPPGMRVDELSNTFVVSQHVLDGNYRFFFPDASGHEGLWHAMQAGFIALFGYTPFGMRGISAILGTLTIPLTYLIGRDLFDRHVGLFAAAGMSVSFWSLMYSRVATRHIATLPFLLLGFWLFWRWVAQEQADDKQTKTALPLLPALFLGLTLHTYFAGWVVVAVTVVFCGYLLLFHRAAMRGRWIGAGLMFVVVGLIALPVLRDMRAMPAVEEEGRINVVAAPLHAARDGDFSLIWEHVVGTFGMFVNTGDSEWLYNVAFRPIFAPPIAVVFWLGVAIMLYHIFSSRLQSRRHIFLLFWWVAGLSPAFISVPPGSMGHTLAAQPSVYIILALPLAAILNRFHRSLKEPPPLWATAALFVFLPLLMLGARDLPDYFYDWPSRGNVRFLYHGAYHDFGDWLHVNRDVDSFAISGLLIEPWEKVALELYAPDDIQPRWFNPERAILLSLAGQPATIFGGYPDVEEAYEPLLTAPTDGVAEYKRFAIAPDATLANTLTQPICFENGLCLEGVSYTAPLLDLRWVVKPNLMIVPRPLTSFPPIPGEDKGPRLYVFAQLLTEDGTFQSGDDGLWVDPETLQAGDVFQQRHVLFPQEGAFKLAVGLYDPATGQRVLTTDGLDHVDYPLSTFE